jgi:hypothetical protein
VESKNMVIKLGFMKTLRGNIFEGVLMELSWDNLKLLHGLENVDILNKFAYQVLVLNTLGGIVFGHLPAKQSLKESEIFECLRDSIGWKKEKRLSISVPT